MASNAAKDAPSNAASAAPGSGQGKNFSALEERQLCLSFLHVSQDPLVGNGQKAGKFWARIDKHYNEKRPVGTDFRPARSLESKWSAIKHDMSKFVASHQAVLALHESGTNEQDQIDKALQLYKSSHPKNHSFTFLESWRILRDIPKWNELGDKTMKLKQSSSFKQGILADATISSANRENQGDASVEKGKKNPIAPSPEYAYGMKRPCGNKSAKEQLKKSKLVDSTLREQVKASQFMAEASLMKATLNLFSMDASNMDSIGQEYLKLQKTAELARLKCQMLAEGDVEGSNFGPPLSPITPDSGGNAPTHTATEDINLPHTQGDHFNANKGTAWDTEGGDAPANDYWNGDTDICSDDE